MSLVLQAIIVALIGGILFAIIGVVPGTDETATMAPITLILLFDKRGFSKLFASIPLFPEVEFPKIE